MYSMRIKVNNINFVRSQMLTRLIVLTISQYMYTNIKQLHCTYEIHIILYVNYDSIKEKIFKKQNFRSCLQSLVWYP